MKKQTFLLKLGHTKSHPCIKIQDSSCMQIIPRFSITLLTTTTLCFTSKNIFCHVFMKFTDSVQEGNTDKSVYTCLSTSTGVYLTASYWGFVTCGLQMVYMLRDPSTASPR